MIGYDSIGSEETTSATCCTMRTREFLQSELEKVTRGTALAALSPNDEVVQEKGSQEHR